MRRELSKAEVERLFVGAIDGALPAADARRLETELASDEALGSEFARYQRAVSLLRGDKKTKAPDALASSILRRTRRRRFAVRTQQAQEAFFSFPAEVIIPLLLAAVVAVMILSAAR